MWATGARRPASLAATGPACGFTLVELMAALAIAAVIMAVAVPASMKLYDSMQYRQTVRDVVTLFASARYEAVNSGRAQNVEVHPQERWVRFGSEKSQLPGNVSVTVHAARELNYDGLGVIRFYPEGGASGGGVDIETDSGRGVRIEVDWLRGSVSQERYAER